MNYIKSEKYNTPDLQKKIMGPNPVKLEEELLFDNKIKKGAVVCDLGSGQGLACSLQRNTSLAECTLRICGATLQKIENFLMKWDLIKIRLSP